MKYNLSQLATICYGKNQKAVESPDGAFPIFGTGGLMGMACKYLYDKPSVLIGRKGTIDKVRFVESPFWTVDTLFYTKINERLVLPYFFYCLMQTVNLKQMNEGTTIPSLRVETLNKVVFDIPDLSAQKKIVRLLRTIDQKIQNNNSINGCLSSLAMSIIERFYESTNVRKCVPLEEVADCQNGYAFYKDGYDDEGALVIDLGNVTTEGVFIFTSSDKYIALNRYSEPKLAKFVVLKDDLIMVMTDRKNTMDLLGKTGKVFTPGKYLLNQRMYRIRAKANVSADYLYAVLNSTSVSNYLKAKALGSVQKYVNTGDIKTIPIPILEEKRMEELANRISPLFGLMERNYLEIRSLAKHRDSLLPRLVSGEIDVDDIEV